MRWSLACVRASIALSAMLGCGPRSIPDAPTCDASEPLVQPGTRSPSGYSRCEDGLVHRVEAVACDLAEAVGSCEGIEPDDALSPNDFSCHTDADCDAGYCNGRSAPWPSCACERPCASDDECATGEICHCDGATSLCIAAACRTDDDCPPDAHCGLIEVRDGCGTARRSLACTDVRDGCRVASDCDGDEPYDCVWAEATGHRECRPSSDLCG